MNFYKFTNTDKKPLTIKDEISFLKDKLSSQFNFGYNNLTNNGYYKEMGWLYDFTDILKKYVVKTEYHLFETYHLNKTDLRNNLTGVGKIHYIKEI